SRFGCADWDYPFLASVACTLPQYAELCRLVVYLHQPACLPLLIVPMGMEDVPLGIFPPVCLKSEAGADSHPSRHGGRAQLPVGSPTTAFFSFSFLCAWCGWRRGGAPHR